MKKYLVVLLMFGCVCRASITLFNMTSRKVVREFEDYSTHLSPQFPSEGLKGQHRYLRVANECSSDLPPAPKDADNLWFALLKYNSLCYPQQILNIQWAGYSAAVLSNSEYDDEDDDDGVIYYKTSSHNEVKQSSTSNDIVKKNISLKIPSTFVSNKTEAILIEYSGKPNITMAIYPKRYDFNRFLLILLGTLCLAIVVALVLFMVGYGCYRLYKIRKSIITKWKLKFLPSHTFRKGDTYEVCVICLDEYLEGARLRILSCGHAFHRKCVDPWLIKSGRECPLCKRKADLRRGRVKKCVEDDDDDGSSADERTALLRDEGRDLDEEDEDDDINQVRIMPDQQTTINAIVHSSEEPPRMSGWRNYGSTRSEPPPSENLPQIVIRNGQGNASESRNQTPPKPVEGDKNRLGTSSVQHPIPHLQDDRSRATFYIGSVATDDGGLQDAGDRRPVVEGGENPSGHRRPSDEESEEDYYDVRNEDQVV